MNTQQIDSTRPSASRRRLLSASAGMAGAVAAVAAASSVSSVSANAATAGVTASTSSTSHHHGGSYVSAKDGTQIFFKDWGTGEPVVFSHGWPLSADAWDAQMLFLVNRGYRVIAHDRRGHGRSGQPSVGNDMDTYADDLAAVLDALDVRGAMLVGHSTGGGEVAHYIGRHGEKRVAKAVLIGAVPPQMVKSANNPEGLPMSVFDGIRAGVAANRSQFYLDLTTPFYGFNRPDAKVSQGLVQDFWRQGMAGSIKGQYECIRQFSEVDYTDDLKKISVPTLILHGDDDQIVPIDDSAKLSAKIVRNATLKVYKGAPHGMCSTHVDQVNADLLGFLKS
ncbi:alpha/beta hydrolase [Paraburkholderia sp. MMS20-SJTN17]|uniref:Alpha/beta hydrolase n=1 Tax=Paraburkholderia translucens TaxID=2886945 RepID=A0ABS8KLJ3_9BURK|nr:alpha/beta hydrolase [Paraburkholderia sp. MMS20-SJTN17]MCC8405595.1 alpha/beta hydrolase [Paraburkholderia sp. MMS20-SJTN17]